MKEKQELEAEVLQPWRVRGLEPVLHCVAVLFFVCFFNIIYLAVLGVRCGVQDLVP